MPSYIATLSIVDNQIVALAENVSSLIIQGIRETASSDSQGRLQR